MTIHEQVPGTLALSRLKQQFDAAWWQDFMRQTRHMTAPATITAGLATEQAQRKVRHLLKVLHKYGGVTVVPESVRNAAAVPDRECERAATAEA